MFNIFLGIGLFLSYYIYENSIKQEVKKNSYIFSFFFLIVTLFFVTYMSQLLIGFKSITVLIYILPIYLYLSSKYFGLPYGKLSYFLTKPVLITLIISKIGCYFEGCCSGFFLIPIQLFELILYFVVYLHINDMYSNNAFKNSMIYILIIRYISDYFRLDVEYFIPFISNRQIIIIPILIFYMKKNLHY